MPEESWEERSARYDKFAALSAREVESLLEQEYDPYPEDHEWHGDPVSGESVWSEWELFETREIPGLGRATVVQDVGGGEGSGEQLYKIVRVEGDPYGVRYFEKPGWYMSYDGRHYDGDLIEVVPEETVVTVYRKVER